MAVETGIRPSVAVRTAKGETAAKRAWLDQRKTYLGATDVGAILGVNPYVSAHDVWLDKKGLKEDTATIPTRMGTYLEPFIAKEYQNLTGAKIRKSRLYRHPVHQFCACNPDREITMEHDGHKLTGLLECKSVGHWASKNFGQDGSDQIPAHYMVQVLWQLIVTRADFVHLAALIDNRELRIFTYTLKPELSTIAHVFPPDLVKSTFSKVVNFWKQHIEADVEPPLSGHDSDTEWMQNDRRNYGNGERVIADDEIDRQCVRLGKAKKREARAKFAVAERANRVKKFMGENGASELETSVGDFTYRTNIKGVGVFKTPFTTDRA